MTQGPKVSVIVPVFNSEDYLAEAIESVHNQTYKDWELILIDDGSTDGSRGIMEDYVNRDARIRAIYLSENSGAAIARNKGIEAARGRFISFLDSDDLWLPGKLESQIHFMETNGHVFTYTAYQKINLQGQQISSVIRSPAKVSYNDLLRSCVISCITIIYDAETMGKHFMPNIRRAQDYALWLQLLKKVEFAYGLDECHSSYRIRQNSISANKFRKALYQWRVYRQIERLSFARSSRLFVEYAIRGFGRWLR